VGVWFDFLKKLGIFRILAQHSIEEVAMDNPCG